jgi:hypothetical protein
MEEQNSEQSWELDRSEEDTDKYEDTIEYLDKLETKYLKLLRAYKSEKSENDKLQKQVETREQHIFHHSDGDGARVNAKIEHNSRGNNWEATVTGASTVDEAMTLLRDAESKLRMEFGDNAKE